MGGLHIGGTYVYVYIVYRMRVECTVYSYSYRANLLHFRFVTHLAALWHTVREAFQLLMRLRRLETSHKGWTSTALVRTET